jgi:small subunit ribosomal protein S17
MPKRILTGRVKSDKMDKTRVVQIARLVRHPKYGKIYRDRTTCYVHDENNESKEGDTVQIIESAPFSKKKRWALVSVIEKSNEVDVAAMKAARKLKEAAGDGEPVASENTAETATEETASE